jgi:hypothetical protein
MGNSFKTIRWRPHKQGDDVRVIKKKKVEKPTRQLDGSFGPIPPATKRGFFEINGYPRLQRPDGSSTSSASSGHHIVMTRGMRARAVEIETIALTHLDFCSQCDLITDALVHLDLFRG